MKRIAVLVLALMLMTSCALAQQLPGVDVYSPGLVRLAELMKTTPAVHMEASLSAADAFHTRDLSVLRAMLEGTTFVYDGAPIESGYADRLQIVRGEEMLFSGAMMPGVLDINGEAFAFAQESDAHAQAMLDFVQQTAILERAPLAEVEAFLLSLDEGDMLIGGWQIAQPFSSVQTMSDDGTRLTRINIEGAIAKEGDAPWVIKGYFKQPAGRAPKDTFELTATKDEDNYLELSYSSLRQSEITKKNKAGQNNVDTNIKIAGKIGGYRVTTRLTVYLRNTWTADGENLNEKVVVSATVEHQDNTPGRQMQRMNLVEGKMRHEIRLTTNETANDVISFTDNVTLNLVMDEKTVFDAEADLAMTVGGEAETIAVTVPAEETDMAQIEAAVTDAVQEIAKKVYAQLPEKTKSSISDGLESEQ